MEGGGNGGSRVRGRVKGERGVGSHGGGGGVMEGEGSDGGGRE